MNPPPPVMSDRTGAPPLTSLKCWPLQHTCHWHDRAKADPAPLLNHVTSVKIWHAKQPELWIVCRSLNVADIDTRVRLPSRMSRHTTSVKKLHTTQRKAYHSLTVTDIDTRPRPGLDPRGGEATPVCDTGAAPPLP